MQNSAAQAYSQTAKTAQSPRELEADLLVRAASRLQTVYDDWDNSSLHPALTFNRRLWTIFSTSVTRAENPLPDTIKQNIANLGVFILKQTNEVTLRPEREKLKSLISINREIAAGLRGQ